MRNRRRKYPQPLASAGQNLLSPAEEDVEHLLGLGKRALVPACLCPAMLGASTNVSCDAWGILERSEPRTGLFLQCLERPPMLEVPHRDVLLGGDMFLGLSTLWQRSCPCPPSQRAETPVAFPVWE